MALTFQPGARLVVATHNPGKVPEIGALLDGRFTLISAGELGLLEPEETEATFMGNAVLKARAAADASGLPALADDSGFCAGGLGGAPGVYSARWAGEPRDFAAAMARVERELDECGGGDDRAWFSSALALAWPHGPVVAVEGRADGKAVFPGRGTRGFGYDPIFQPDGASQTFGEMAPEAKSAISHRAKAFAKLKSALF